MADIPTTKAGKRLLQVLDETSGDYRLDWAARDILAIEAEAVLEYQAGPEVAIVEEIKAEAAQAAVTHCAGLEHDAQAAERARFADWLASELSYPFDVTFSVSPPVSAYEMAEAWYRQDSSATLDEWFVATSGEEPTLG